MKTVTCWFNAAAYGLPPSGSFGNAGRNTLPGPDYKEFDVALVKHAKLGERTFLKFRAGFFNVVNHPNFSVPMNTTGPNGNGGNGNAVIVGRDALWNPLLAQNGGQIFSTVGSSRQLQFGLRVNF